MLDDDSLPRDVLLTADTVGGVFTYAMTLSRELASRGIDVHLATMGGALSDAQRADVLSIPFASVHESTFRLEWMDEPWDDVARAADWLRDVASRVRPDVVHVNDYGHAADGFDAPVVIGAHSCVASWWDAVLREPLPGRYARYMSGVRRGLDAAALVIAPTRAMMRALERAHGPVKRKRVVYNGAEWPGTPRSRREPFVLAAGRLWDQAKNVAALTRVATRLPLPLVLAGSTAGPGGEELALDGVQAVGWLDAMTLHGLMDRASIFAAPARYEPFGLAILEAAQRGAGLVLGEIPSLRELWDEAALFVHPDDDDGIVDAVTTLSSDETLRRRLTERAARRAAELSASLMADETLAAYRAARDASGPSAMRVDERAYVTA